MGTLSVNQMAWKIAQKLIDSPEFYGVNVSKSISGATIIDAGVNALGGFRFHRWSASVQVVSL